MKTGSRFRQPYKGPTPNSGSILVGVLWCLVILSVVVIGGLHTARMDLMIANNQVDQIRAHYLALAGIEKAKALLYKERKDNQQTGYAYTTQLLNSEENFKDQEFGGGQFRILRPPTADETGVMIYGVSDESGRLNINTADLDTLTRLPQMDPGLAARIIDYRDTDSNLTANGAEAETYMAMVPPRMPRNAPFQTTWDLLAVDGMSREYFLGEDQNMNGMLDVEEDNGDLSPPTDNGNGILDSGLSQWVTHASFASQLNPRGEPRIDIQSASESELMTLNGMSSDMAQAIVNHRSNNEFQSIADLLEVRESSNNRNNNNNNGGGNNSRGRGGSRSRNQGRSSSNNNNNNNSGNSGRRMITQSQLAEFADSIMVGSETELAGSININVAPREVLQCLPGVDQIVADSIIRYRQSNGSFKNIAELLNVQGLNRNLFRQIAGRICVKSDTFRIFSEGKFGTTGARKRIEVIVRMGEYDFETLSYKEDL